MDKAVLWLNDVPKANPVTPELPVVLGKHLLSASSHYPPTPPASSHQPSMAEEAGRTSPDPTCSNKWQRRRRGSRGSEADENDPEDYSASGDCIRYNTPRAVKPTHPRLDRTPTASSTTSRSDRSNYSRPSRSTTKRIRRLEVADNKFFVLQIDRGDKRMPAALKQELA
ncbi:hypothetical protein Micbo1qcDRAFT_169273 [Microdochium bolleyi]|uniref:Uncharacterized protein n=1 Tax=Microdochium bolleyi TaxID=196109 RepID=A0A136IKU5_9PEZI|nr:hypothetical protein Micbo1qcDRAFT_169273 [Microdochium bolleyi]